MFPLLSEHETAPESGSIATLTMTPWPTATPPEIGVMESVVPTVSVPFAPRSWSQQTAP